MKLSTVTFLALTVLCGIKAVHADDSWAALVTQVGLVVGEIQAWKQNTTKQLEVIWKGLRRVERERDAYKEGLGKLTTDIMALRLQVNQTVNNARSYARMRCCGMKETKRIESSLSTTLSTIMSTTPNTGSTTVTPSPATDRDLYSASKDGDLERVKQILSAGKVNINARGWLRGSMTAVMVAALNGHKEVVEVLVDKGANVSLVNVNGYNILHYACMGGDLETVRLILSRNLVDINATTTNGKTAADMARVGDHWPELGPLFVRALKTVPSQGPSQQKTVPKVTTQDPDPHETPSLATDADLFSASSRGDLERVKQILAAGHMDINSRQDMGMTPVMAAARRGHSDMVKLLVDRGADVSLVDEDGNNVLHLACTVEGDLETVKLILSLNMVDIDSRGDLSRTPMMIAAVYAHNDVVELLVDRGADVSLVDEDGNNVLHLACWDEGGLETVKLILSLNKVDINAMNNEGKTARDLARYLLDQQVLEYLVSHGAS